MSRAVALAIRRRIEQRLPAKTVNFWCHVIEGAFASFGGELVGLTVVFSVLAAALGATPAALGLLVALPRLAVIAPLLAAPRVEAVQRKKRLVLLLGVGQRVPHLLVAGALLLFAQTAPLICLFIIALLNLATAVVVSLLVPPWMDLLAETIPSERMGRVFGYRNALSSTLGLLSAGVSAAIIASFAFPGNYAILYVVGFGSLAVSWLIFALVDEIPEGTAAQRQPAGQYFRNLIRALREDVDYRRFLVYKGLSRLGLAAMPFYVLAAVTYHGVSQAFAAGTFIAALSAAKITGNLAFPRVSDRLGHKRVIGLGAAFSAGAAALAALAPSGAWYVGVFFLAGLGGAATTVSGAPFMMSVYPRGRRIGYMTLSMAALAPVAIAAAPAAGLLMQAFGHAVLFVLAGVVILAALVPLRYCTPRVCVAERDPSASDGPGADEVGDRMPPEGR